MVHIRDFLDYLVAKAENGTGGGRRRKPKALDAVSLSNIDLSATLASAKILRPVLFVPPSMPAVELLVRMQTTRTHMALVIDEYGGTDGLVSIEDLVEMVVGDIEDEHDLASQAMIEASGPDTFVADARADLEEASQVIGFDFTQGEVAEEVDTLGGLIVALAGRVPARSELIAGPENFEFEVLDADPRRLKRVRIHRRDPSLKLVPAGVATGVAGRRGANGAGAGTPASDERPADSPAAPAEAAAPAPPPADPDSRSPGAWTALAHRVVLAWGWRRALIALLAGAVGALAMPPFGRLPGPRRLAGSRGLAHRRARLARDGPRARRRGGDRVAVGASAISGRACGGSAWPSWVDAERYAWAMPLGVVALPAALAVFYALGFALARVTVVARGRGRILALCRGDRGGRVAARPPVHGVSLEYGWA